MSVVTGIMIVCSVSEDEGAHSAIGQINAWLENEGFGPLRDTSDEGGGTKHPQFLAYQGGYNYFSSHSEFMAFATSLAWEEPERAIIIIQPEEGKVCCRTIATTP